MVAEPHRNGHQNPSRTYPQSPTAIMAYDWSTGQMTTPELPPQATPVPIAPTPVFTLTLEGLRAGKFATLTIHAATYRELAEHLLNVEDLLEAPPVGTIGAEPEPEPTEPTCPIHGTALLHSTKERGVLYCPHRDERTTKYCRYTEDAKE